MSETTDLDKQLDEKRTEDQFPEKYKNFSIVQSFVQEIHLKNTMRCLMTDVMNRTRKILLKNPNQKQTDLCNNLSTAIKVINGYCNYRKISLTDQLYILELVRMLTPEQRKIYTDMRKAMGVDVLGHALEGDIDVGEIFGLQRKIKGKQIIEESDESNAGGLDTRK